MNRMIYYYNLSVYWRVHKWPVSFLVCAVFIVPACVCSLFTLSMKVKLIRRRIAERRAAIGTVQEKLKRKSEITEQGAMVRLKMLAGRFVLQHCKEQYAEAKSANDRWRYDAYGLIMIAFVEDIPFCVLNSLFLVRIVRDKKEEVVFPGFNRLIACSRL